ncbi:MAG: thioredoxin family protein [Silvibacterium sp.]|nr:thioredoxin family protein [Silvibacterium sp.]
MPPRFSIPALIGTALCLLLLCACAVWAAPSATAPHLTVQLVVPPTQIYSGQNFSAGLYFKLDRGWHVYWVNAGDSGEPPSVKWTLPPGVTAGPLQFPAPKRLPLGPLMDFGYDNEVLFPIAMHVAPDFKPSGPDTTLAAKVNWLVCREVCIPGKAQLSVDRAALAQPPAVDSVNADDAQLLERFKDRLPQPLPAGDSAKFRATANGFELSIQTGHEEKSAAFFPFDQSVLTNAAAQPVTPLKDGVSIALTKDENLRTAPDQLNGVLALDNGRAYEIHARPGVLASASVETSNSLVRIVVLAFIGGVILNLMPCVFPVLFIKGLALVQSSGEERRKLRMHGVVYTLGILVSFWVIVGALLALRGAGHNLGWGFQFQSPTFDALIAMLLFFLGLSLAGQFEIGLTLTSAGSSLAVKSGYTGSFFTGVLAVIVATPCTAPFMGAAIGYALSNSPMVGFAVFTALALGLAAPYLLLTLNPAWTRLLPRPGAWMEILKQAVSIPIFATVIWLVWVFTQTAGVSALVNLLAAFLLLAIAGWILGHWPAKAGSTIAAASVLVLAVALPVMAVRKGPERFDLAVVGMKRARWEPFTPELVAKYRSQGRPVFIDFTASWCLSCQVNERVVLNREDVQKRLQNSGVALLRADWTRHDETIAQTLASLGRNGVPTYALYPADPQAPPVLLPEVLTPDAVFQALDGIKPVSARATTGL